MFINIITAQIIIHFINDVPRSLGNLGVQMMEVFDKIDDTFRYIYSSTVDSRVQVKMYFILWFLNKSYTNKVLSICSYCNTIPILCRGTLEGLRGDQQKPPFEKLLNDPLLRFSGLYAETSDLHCAPFMIKLQVFDGNKELCLAVTTSYKTFTTRWR